MSSKQPCRVSIKVDDHGRGVFIINDMDISLNVSACKIEIVAQHRAIVTFSVFVDDLLMEGDTSIGLEHVTPPKD